MTASDAPFHITNGDSAGALIQTAFPDDTVLPWRDPMHHGPFPADHDLTALRPLRARHLAGGGFSEDAVYRDLQARDDQLLHLTAQRPVTLWFEHDLLDQLQLLQILDTLARLPHRPQALSLICIDAYPGIAPFRGLGQLSAAQIGALSVQQQPVTDAVLKQAQQAWQAFCAPDPRGLLALHTPELPLLQPALHRHAQEFPDSRTGLSRTETQILRLVSQGVNTPVDLFVQNMALETALFLGDLRSFSVIADLHRWGLLDCAPEPLRVPPAGQDLRGLTLTLTAQGQAALLGRRPLGLDRDQWLGGVHLVAGQPGWVWDADAQALTKGHL